MEGRRAFPKAPCPAGVQRPLLLAALHRGDRSGDESAGLLPERTVIFRDAFGCFLHFMLLPGAGTFAPIRLDLLSRIATRCFAARAGPYFCAVFPRIEGGFSFNSLPTELRMAFVLATFPPCRRECGHLLFAVFFAADAGGYRAGVGDAFLVRQFALEFCEPSTTSGLHAFRHTTTCCVLLLLLHNIKYFQVQSKHHRTYHAFTPSVELSASIQ